jgi:hypothetical protein
LFVITTIGLVRGIAAENMFGAAAMHTFAESWKLQQPVDTIIANAAHETPLQLAILAAKLSDLHRLDEGLFWSFIAIPRMLILGRIAPESVRGIDAGSLVQALSLVYETYGACDPKRTLEIFDRAVNWDEQNKLDLSRYEGVATIPKDQWAPIQANGRKAFVEDRQRLAKIKQVPEACTVGQ